MTFIGVSRAFMLFVLHKEMCLGDTTFHHLMESTDLVKSILILVILYFVFIGGGFVIVIRTGS